MLLGLSSPRFDSHPETTAATHPRVRDERGLIMSTPLALVSAGAVLLSGVVFFLTGSPSEPEKVTLTFVKQVTAPRVTLEVDPTIDARARARTYVVVFNNSSIAGLANRTSTKLSDAGWNVVGSDNWFGTIPATTVYYPERLKAQAQLLAKDLHVQRVLPAIDPMQRDRLTVILTQDFGG